LIDRDYPGGDLFPRPIGGKPVGIKRETEAIRKEWAALLSEQNGIERELPALEKRIVHMEKRAKELPLEIALAKQKYLSAVSGEKERSSADAKQNKRVTLEKKMKDLQRQLDRLPKS
jgi:chromosome segregation ATPase